MASSAALLLAALLCFAASADAALVKAAQQTALQAVKASLRLTDPKLPNSWKASSDCSAWRGVKCDAAGNVVQLAITPVEYYLTYIELNSTVPEVYPLTIKGTISPKISELKNLEILVFYTTGLVGDIPEGLGNLKKLRFLELSGNNFTSNMPTSVKMLTNLQFLSCSTCKLKGKFPTGISNLLKLEWLDLTVNALSGKLPPGIVNLPKLTTLALANNTLGGKIPVRSTHLKPLEIFVMGSNKFSGEIPKWVFAVPFVLLGNNRLVGKIPKLPNSTFVIELSSNYLSGEVVISEESLGSSFLLSGNYFSSITGGSPTSVIFVDDNCLSGALAVKFGKQKKNKVCNNFCNAKQKGGACGKNGVCGPGGAKAPTCTCKKGYFTFVKKFTCTKDVPTPSSAPPVGGST